MDTLLTLIIALGGIATGICAIWAALAARREGQACRVGRGLEMELDTATFREFPFHALRCIEKVHGGQSQREALGDGPINAQHTPTEGDPLSLRR